ncbi:flagellar hook-basal body complex protein FliE [Silvibacterium sp.]|uniref:flagellar hook-basal body complex protein FliE n=1 Tax=Silvibacterium sp. TaxID=1964179 RepID=UPI0039E2EAA2
MNPILLNAVAGSGVTPAFSATPASGLSGGASGGELPFSDLLRTAFESEQQLESQASSTVQGLMAGDGVDVHEAMIATQKANLAFEMTLAVRNKAVAAYQQLMQMQF